MPAKSKEQQQLMAIALHHPSKVYKRNRGVLKMKKKSLRDFATTKLSGSVRSARTNILQEINQGRGHAALKAIALKRREKK